MYRTSSPIFDVPEFPPLRKVKPLPKRRRTSEPLQQDVRIPTPGFLGPDATAEELIAHAGTLSAHMALQSYYMPILGGVQDLLKTNFGADGLPNPIDFGIGFGVGGGKNGREDEERGDGDYMDHLQQPGNTKKRKVPANASGSSRVLDAGNSGEEEEPTERGAVGRADDESADIPESSAGTLGQRKGKMSPATLVGLQHKEMLKQRKRQLLAVLGALSHGDTLALDQALSANYPFANSALGGALKNSGQPKVRLSRRRASRFARALRVLHQNVPLSAKREENLPGLEFTFACHSSTSERLIATKEEVATLHARFETELARQAAKAAEAAKLTASSLRKSKRTDRTKQRAGTTKAGADQNASLLDSSLLGSKSPSGKKKKRSALANASNPHHLRNYVPSRLPQSQVNPAQANHNAQNYLGPFPLRFLSAEIAPRHRKKSEVTPVTQLINPVDEWICPFCEYELFYGDDHVFRRAVRNRQKILRRRRRARERAAAAASGKSSVRSAEKSDPVDDDVNPGFAPPHADVPMQNKWTETGREGGSHDIAPG